MADPLSLAASIIAVVSLTDQVLTSSYTFIGKVKSATADVHKVIHEISLLKGVFLNLQELGDDVRGGANFKALAGPNGSVSICLDALREMKAKLQPVSTILTTKRKLLWPFESKKLDEILERIRNQNPALLLALSADTAWLTRDIQDGVRNVQNSLEFMQAQERREKIFTWLHANDPKTKHRDSREVHEEGSNQWILELREFSQWKDTPGQTMWLHGIPGSGKTILCSTVIDHIEKLCQTSPNSRLAYYYFDFNDPTSQRLDVLLRSLLVQLCRPSDDLPESLGILYDGCSRGLSNPPVESLVEIFFELLNDETQTYIIVDGLDECPYAGEGSERSQFHKSILARIGQCSRTCNFLFTSRDEYDIREAMKITASQSILHMVAVDTEKVDADIRMRVRRFVYEHHRISGWSIAVKKEIEDALVSGSQGMHVFLWVDRQLTSIGKCVLPGIARKQLRQLPKTIYETYDRILSSLSDENIVAARSALMFLAYSQRPLLVEELAEAVLINVEEQYFSTEERCNDPLSVILELCSSLVTVTAVSDVHRRRILEERHFSRTDSSTVCFAHYSVKEYIVSEHHRHSNIAGYFFSEVEAHHYIAEALLIYILDIEKGDSIKQYQADYSNITLSTYAAKYWPKHCLKIPTNSREPQLIAKIHQLFDPDDPTHYMHWLRSWRPDYPGGSFAHSYHSGRSVTDFPPPLYFASLIGDTETCEWLLSKGCSISDPSGDCALGDPLQAAAFGGHTNIVRLLLNHGAPVNTDHGYFGDALQAASFGGFERTVKLLIENSATINTKHGEYSTPLIAASQNGHFAVAKELIERGANPEIGNRKYGLAIAGAAASGNVELVKLFLSKGNKIDDPNGTRGSALYAASESGNLNLVSMLIRAGANINMVSGDLHTALQAACSEGHTNIVKHLLANGASVNIFGGKFDSALQASIDHGNLEIFQMLLSRGADINHQGGKFKSPLRCAVFRGGVRTRAAEILIDAGAVFDEEIFLMAVEYGHKSLVQRMLLRGVNVNAQGPKGTALQLAIQGKDIDTSWALLKSDEIELDTIGGEHGGTALHTALEVGNENIVEELLRRGASANFKGGEYYTPLTAAIETGSVKLIQLLLDYGAVIKSYQGGWYYSPLIVAARKGLEGVVRTLLDAGMDVEEFAGRDNDEQQQNALQAACRLARLDVVKLLILRGANPNSIGGKEGTALAAAVKSQTNYVDDADRLKVISYLLENGASPKCPVGTDMRCSGKHSYSTPLDLAIQYGESNLIALFMEKGAEFCPQSVLEAAGRGHCEMVKKMIGLGVSVNKEGCSPLMAAINAGNDDMIQILIEAGADVSAQMGGKWNYGCPLVHAIERANTKLVRQLVSLGADVNGRGGVFGSALRHAAHHSDLEAVCILLQNGADVNASTDDFRSPLASAVYSANENLIRKLLDAGADVNIDEGEPLRIAAGRGKMHIVELLLESGAKLHIQQGIEEHTLQRAASHAHKNVCELFIKHGADVNAQGGENGNPLQAAVSQYWTNLEKVADVVQYLLSVGADPKAPPSGSYVSPLHAAVVNGKREILDILIGAGVNVNAHDPELGTALIAAARHANPLATYKLLDCGANPHLLGGKYGSVLHAAAHEHAEPVLERLLIKEGMDAKLCCGRYGYALQAACKRSREVQHLNCVRLLLQHGAEINARGGKYDTAIQCAAKHGNLDTVQLLLEHGADPTLEGGKYKSPLDAAKTKKHWHVANYLEKHIRKNFAGRKKK